jgi:hypothetical protein
MHKSSLCTMHKLLSAPRKLLVHPQITCAPQISGAPPKFFAHAHMHLMVSILIIGLYSKTILRT